MYSEQEFIRRIYEECLSVDPRQFHNWAIGLLRESIHFDAALWCKGHDENQCLRGIKSSLLPDSYTAAFTRMSRHNAVYAACLAHPEKAFGLVDLYPNRKERIDTQIYQRLLRPFGIHKQIGLALANPAIGEFTYLELYRGADATHFSTADKDSWRRLAPHLVGAQTLSLFVHAAQPAAPYWHQAAGLCDEDGRIIDCQASLVRLLLSHFPHWRGESLPFDLPKTVSPQVVVIDRLNVYIETQAELFLIRVWEKNPLDALSRREREVTLAVSRGFSFKAIGRQLKLSDSTVSNHVYRAYRKLGISSRTQLAELMLDHQE